jgi:putative membrane protein
MSNTEITIFRLLIHWLISATAVYVTAHMLPGIAIRSFGAALIVALVLGLVNVLIKPVLVFFSIPFLLVTLGLFMLVINALMLQLAAWMVDGFAVQSFWWAMLGSLCISLVAWLMSAVLNI